MTTADYADTLRAILNSLCAGTINAEAAVQEILALRIEDDRPAVDALIDYGLAVDATQAALSRAADNTVPLEIAAAITRGLARVDDVAAYEWVRHRME